MPVQVPGYGGASKLLRTSTLLPALKKKTTTTTKTKANVSYESGFIWGQNEDYSPGQSTLDSSERLLQRGKGEGQQICNFSEGIVHAIKHIFSFCPEGFCQSSEGNCSS